jgi:hypothetical protein
MTDVLHIPVTRAFACARNGVIPRKRHKRHGDKFRRVGGEISNHLMPMKCLFLLTFRRG